MVMTIKFSLYFFFLRVNFPSKEKLNVLWYCVVFHKKTSLKTQCGLCSSRFFFIEIEFGILFWRISFFKLYTSHISSDSPKQKYTRQRSFLQYLNSDFLFYLGWSGSVSTKQAKYNEGCSKLNYLLAEV